MKAGSRGVVLGVRRSGKSAQLRAVLAAASLDPKFRAQVWVPTTQSALDFQQGMEEVGGVSFGDLTLMPNGAQITVVSLERDRS